MVSKKTYEDIMNSYSSYFPHDMDTREGTLVHLVKSVTAMSIAELYEELAILEENAYGVSATGSWLDKSVAILGLERLGKVNALVKIEGDEGLYAGDVVQGGELTYTITEVKDGYYVAQCNTAGMEGNSYLGEVLPANGAALNLSITAIILKGSEEEDDESLRRRYLERLVCPVCMGNVSYYKDAIHSLLGVGGIKVVPVPEGAGTVKVVITDNEYNMASDELINYVKEYLDPAEHSGMGYGVVPIGHSVEVGTVEKVDVHITVEINGGAVPQLYMRTARPLVKKAVKELNPLWDSADNIIVWNRLIEDVIFDISEEIKDVKVTSINGEISRLILGEHQIVGEVYINED
ncbi:MAG: baseplate J/gp47 family protein [Clostridia bacterium]|nr:baseplate J/gp47 family protein [Clostridia bacterium]